MKKIIILNGRGGVGKDTFVDFCASYCYVRHISSITPIKEIAKNIGWEGAKTERDRKFLSDLKDLLTDYSDVSMKYIAKEVTRFQLDKTIPSASILFIDIREPYEIDRAKEEFNAITVLIKNRNVPLITTNHADYEAENYNYDIVIKNDGSFDELKETAKQFMERMRVEL